MYVSMHAYIYVCRVYRCMYVCVRVPCSQNHKTNGERATHYSYEIEYFNTNEMCTENKLKIVRIEYIEDI